MVPMAHCRRSLSEGRQSCSHQCQIPYCIATSNRDFLHRMYGEADTVREAESRPRKYGIFYIMFNSLNPSPRSTLGHYWCRLGAQQLITSTSGRFSAMVTP